MFPTNLDGITNYLTTLAHTLPLPLFVIIGSVVEEIISPIPATLILGLAGGLVATNGNGVLYLSGLTLLATIGKTLAAWVTYWAGRLLGKIVIKKWGYVLGISYEQLIETSHEIRKHKGSWKWIFAMRALPIAPSGAVSIAAGIIYTHQRVFLTATFLGYIVRNVLTAATGYFGLDVILNWDEHVSDPVVLILFIALAAVIGLYIATLRYNQPKAKK